MHTSFVQRQLDVAERSIVVEDRAVANHINRSTVKTHGCFDISIAERFVAHPMYMGAEGKKKKTS